MRKFRPKDPSHKPNRYRLKCCLSGRCDLERGYLARAPTVAPDERQCRGEEV